MMKKIIMYIMIGLLFTQCTKEVIIKESDINKQLVPQCLFSPDSLWTVYLQKTANVLEKEENEYITDGTVVIKNNDGSIVANLFHTKDGKYVANSEKPEDGKEYIIEVSSTEYPDILSTNSYIPAEVDFTVDTIRVDRDGMSLMEFSFHINDDPDVNNYYIVHVYREDDWGYHNNIWMTSNDVNLEKTNIGEFEQDFSGSFMFLDDEVFNGKSYTLKCEVFRHNLGIYDNYENNDGPKIYLIVSNCTKECYRYMLSLEQSSQTYNDPFITPMNLYSNFEQNIGIFAGYRDNKIKFKKQKSK